MVSLQIEAGPPTAGHVPSHAEAVPSHAEEAPSHAEAVQNHQKRSSLQDCLRRCHDFAPVDNGLGDCPQYCYDYHQ